MSLKCQSDKKTWKICIKAFGKSSVLCHLMSYFCQLSAKKFTISSWKCTCRIFMMFCWGEGDKSVMVTLLVLTVGGHTEYRYILIQSSNEIRNVPKNMFVQVRVMFYFWKVQQQQQPPQKERDWYKSYIFPTFNSQTGFIIWLMIINL